MSGSASIKNGALWINGNEVRKLSELNPMHDNSSKGEGFKMPVGKQMFVTMRLCNEAMLCTNKSLGVVVITNSQSVVATSTNGTAIKEKLALSTRKRSAAELDITTPSGKENKEGTGKIVSLYFQPSINLDENNWLSDDTWRPCILYNQISI